MKITNIIPSSYISDVTRYLVYSDRTCDLYSPTDLGCYTTLGRKWTVIHYVHTLEKRIRSFRGDAADALGDQQAIKISMSLYYRLVELHRYRSWVTPVEYGSAMVCQIDLDDIWTNVLLVISDPQLS